MRETILTKYFSNNRHVFFFLGFLTLFTFAVVILAEGFGLGWLGTSFVKTLGKTLCLCMVAIAMDLVWGYCGILSLGHFAFFALGGYMIGMWLMFARTKLVVVAAAKNLALPLTEEEIKSAVGTQIFGVVGGAEIPNIWAFADILPAQLAFVILIPGALALIFGWLAFRSRVDGVYLSILTQAMTLALALYLFQNDSGLRGNNGLSGLQNIPGLENVQQSLVSMYFFIASAFILGIIYCLSNLIVSSKLGNIIKGIRDNEERVRFLGYNVEGFKLFIFVYTAIISGIAGAMYYPQAGIINPAELAPIASIYLAVWVAIGGRGRLYGAVIGAAFVSLMSSYFTGGQAPDIALGFGTLIWTDWWLVLLGLSFVLVTIYAPKGIGGVFDLLAKRNND
ncbi:MAG: urea ABC transporter permease subunit UrtC [Rhodospirillaceae bacterium]|nr:urea ABC transporter permease subunit UrtC [Rhodospirillaceae bacterium]OUU22609.1 MAG: urea ABC transporter permease subunit UrtC [Candidatus Endolissoclinum sp. TMED37]